MTTIITIVIENPSEEVLKSLLSGTAKKQKAIIRTEFKQEKGQKKISVLKGKKAATCNEKTCIKCKTKFKPKSNNQRFCSDECRDESLKELKGTLKEIEAKRKETYNLN